VTVQVRRLAAGLSALSSASPCLALGGAAGRAFFARSVFVRHTSAVHAAAPRLRLPATISGSTSARPATRSGYPYATRVPVSERPVRATLECRAKPGPAAHRPAGRRGAPLLARRRIRHMRRRHAEVMTSGLAAGRMA